jgi:hypothetical protein
MIDERIKLLLPPLEAEVVGEALEYRYRAAAGVLAALQQTVPEEEDPLPAKRRPAIED